LNRFEGSDTGTGGAVSGSVKVDMPAAVVDVARDGGDGGGVSWVP
jgi:hypothetical protein